MRSANYETAGWVDKELGIVVNHFSWQNRSKYVFLNVFVNLLLGYCLVMLGRKYNRIQADWLSCFIILYGYLALSIWTQVL